MSIVEVRYGRAERLDTGRRSILTAGVADIDASGADEAAVNLVLDLGSTLAQVGPGVRIVGVTALVGALRCPDDTRRGTCRIKTSVRLMASMGVAEGAVGVRCLLY
jgi:hypothetical protein